MTTKAYHLWTKGDEAPATMPEGCEFLDCGDGWCRSCSNPSVWNMETIPARRWPAEPQPQRPTVFGLLSPKEQAELEKAKKLGNVEYYSTSGWEDEPTDDDSYDEVVYRIKPLQETFDFAVTMNGKPVNPRDFSKESWNNLRG